MGPSSPNANRSSARRTHAWRLTSIIASGVMLASCGGGSSGGLHDVGVDAGGSRDASTLWDTSAPVMDMTVQDVDTAVPEPDAELPPTDADVAPIRIVTSVIGTIDEAGSAVTDVPYGTYVQAFLSGIVASDGTTVIVVDASLEPIDDPATTLLEPTMRLRLVGPGDETRTYTLAFETLLNETVVMVDGTLIRFATRFFTNSPSEYIIVNTAPGGVGTHYCLHSSVESGTYGPQDAGDIGICLELWDPADTNIRAGAYTNFADFDFVFEIAVTETSFSGHYRGFVRRTSDGALLPVWGFMHSDRQESGGWEGS